MLIFRECETIWISLTKITLCNCENKAIRNLTTIKYISTISTESLYPILNINHSVNKTLPQTHTTTSLLRQTKNKPRLYHFTHRPSLIWYPVNFKRNISNKTTALPCHTSRTSEITEIKLSSIKHHTLHFWQV